MKLKTESYLSQKQILSLSQSQSLEILAMSSMELEDFVRREQEENPFLEMPEQGWSYERIAQSSVWSEADGRDALQNISAPQSVTLTEHLLSQLDENGCDCADYRILRYIIESLDDRGYLLISVKELSFLLHQPYDRVLRCIERVRELEPAGVGADCLAQCLELQLARSNQLDKPFQQLLRYHLEEAAVGKHAQVARAIGVSRAQVRLYLDRLHALHPRPAAAFAQEGIQFVVPDIICKWETDAWNIRVSDGWVSCVGLSRLYAGLINSVDDKRVRAYFVERIRRAKFVLQSIEKRRQTLQRIAELTAQRQTAYLLGHGALVPHTMRQLAEIVGVHESTVGRGVRDKYMLTPRGTLPMRILFTGGLGTDEEISRDGVQQALCALIAAENPVHPLSDKELSEQLAARGLAVSRRTVAKYREQLGIQSTTGRKRK